VCVQHMKHRLKLPCCQPGTAHVGRPAHSMHGPAAMPLPLFAHPPPACPPAHLQYMVPCWSKCNKADPSPEAMFKCMNRDCYPEARSKDQEVRAAAGAAGAACAVAPPVQASHVL
jgi:hypothetical protein